jgi:hypothetical protein
MPRDWPTPESTGTRLATTELTSSDSITTSFDGQVIAGQDVIGRIEIRHNDVTIRDTRIQYTTNYGVFIEKVNGVCPTGTMIEHVELDGSRSPDNYAPAYDEGCGYTFDHVYLHNAGTGIRVNGSSTITNSYLVNDTFGPSGAHREPLLVRGSNHVIENNVLICDVPQGGCSAALAIYGDGSLSHPEHPGRGELVGWHRGLLRLWRSDPHLRRPGRKRRLLRQRVLGVANS